MAAAGHDVYFIARGSNLEAIRANGLKVESVLGAIHLPKPNVSADPAEIGPVDLARAGDGRETAHGVSQGQQGG